MSEEHNPNEALAINIVNVLQERQVLGQQEDMKDFVMKIASGNAKSEDWKAALLTGILSTPKTKADEAETTLY